MRFRLEGEPAGGLRIIGEVPEGPLLQLEGRNGIGKSLTIRLLQMCTGHQPFMDRRASWVTLRQHLGPVTVVVDGLKGGRRLEFGLDPAEWPEHPEPIGPWLGTARLDDAVTTWDHVPTILDVRRIGGDETLGESLASQVARDLEMVRQFEARQRRGRERWSGLIADVAVAVAQVGEVDLDELRGRVTRARKALDRREEHRRSLADELDRLHAAGELRRRLARITMEQPRLTSELASLQNQERRLRDQIADLDRRAGDALAAESRSTSDIGEVNHQAALQRKRYERRERRRRQLAAVMAASGWQTSAHASDVGAFVASLTNEAAQLNQRRGEVDRAGLVLEVVDELDEALERAEDDGLGEEVVAQLDRTIFSVTGLRRAVSGRRTVLEATESTDAVELNEHINAVNARLSAAKQLADAFRHLDGAEQDLAATTRALEAAVRSPNATDTYDVVYQERAAHIDELMVVVGDRTQRERQLDDLTGSRSPVEIEEQLAALVSVSAAEPSVFVDETSVSRAIAQIEDELSHATAARGDARRELLEAEDALLRSEGDIDAAVAELRDDPAFGWLSAASARLAGLAGSTTDRLRALQGLDQACATVDQQLLDALNDMQAMTEALAVLDRRLRASGTSGAPDPARRDRFTGAIERLFEVRFAAELSDEALRAVLFGGGTHIVVSLQDMTVRWRLPNGQVNSRPLEAFSSGERAFAYTRVQIERLADNGAENRVVFLDEFGSFVAHDRYAQLKRYLQSQALGRAADKLVVVLPMRTAPSDEAEREMTDRGGYVVSELS